MFLSKQTANASFYVGILHETDNFALSCIGDARYVFLFKMIPSSETVRRSTPDYMFGNLHHSAETTLEFRDIVFLSQ